MTVCIATLFKWNYAKPGDPASHGIAALAASDRMVTAFDVEYEPPQQKVAILSPKTIVMVAGDLAMHSPLIAETALQYGSDIHATPSQIATRYGRGLQAARQKLLEDLYLAPLGLNTDTFIAQQKDLSDNFVNSITGQLQGHKGPEVEALIVGSNGMRAEVWSVDEYGSTRLYNDIGFAAIGIGAWHAKSRLMQIPYGSGFTLAPALAAVLAAKKAAEVAPGVSETTDWHIVTRDGFFPVWRDVLDKASELYDAYEEARKSVTTELVNQLQNYLTPQSQERSTEDVAKEGSFGGSAQTNERPSAPAAEAARPDEAEPPEKEGGE